MAALRPLCIALGLATNIATTAGTATAQDLPCRLALMLGMDISSSVNAGEYDIQKGGLVAALRDEAVIEAILQVEGTQVQMMAYEWSGYVQQDAILRWTRLASRADIAAFTDRLEAHRRVYSDFPTAIGKALEFALVEFERLPVSCAQLTLDLSGDGVNNDGPPAQEFWPALWSAGITVNALVIDGDAPSPVPHYRDEVITGPMAFHLVTRNGFEDYPDFIRMKLLRELAPPMMLSAR